MDRIEKIDIKSKEYPKILREIPNPPKALYCCGNRELLYERNVAVVGSRKNTVYGKCVAQIVGRKLAESGIAVVSGLAYGIDSYAHEGMVEAGGRGVAVLGSGILQMTPRKNYGLMKNILACDGLIVSEYAPDYPASRGTYPQRNRIISGLSESIIVIEANFNSGALITAQWANEQGRTVYAVPGNINSQFSMGSNLLIRDGAIPLIVIDDVIRDMGAEVVARNTDESLGEDEKKIINIVKKNNGISVDRLAIELGYRTSKVNSILTILEIKGLVASYGGKIHLAN